MPGPGGDEVARVSVRVVPDTSGFRSELARELSAIEQSMKVEIPVEADTAGFRAEVRAAVTSMSNEDIDIDVGADTAGARAETKAFAAATEAMTAQIDVGADTALARTEAMATRAFIDAMKATIKVEVDVDKEKLGALTGGAAGGGKDSGGLSALTEAFKAVAQAGASLPGILGSIGEATGKIATTALSAGSGMFNMATGALGMGRAMGGAAAGAAGLAVAIVSVLGKMVAFGAQASLVLAIMGAITAAVGMVGAAISGLPALLLGVGAAAGAVALGMDGIEKAAKVAAPALKELKAEVSSVFEAKLTPMFRDLGERVIPRLTEGLKAVAGSVSDLIINLSEVATSAAGIEDLNALFGNTQVLLSIITPSLQGLLQVFLEIGATTPVFQRLGELISMIIGRVTQLFARFAQGGESSLMVRSIEQLTLVLDAALGAINELILGATEFFTAAGPGMRDMFADIESVIKKIDFKSLGESFGIFARAVGNFFDSIPQSTWDTLVASVRDLALKFEELSNDPNMQELFNMLIRMIPTCINMFTDFLGAVRLVVNFLNTAIPAALGVLEATFTQVFNAVKVVVLSAAVAIIDIFRRIALAVDLVIDAIPFLPRSFGEASQAAVDALTQMRTGVGTELEGTIAEMQGAATKAEAAGSDLGQGAADGAERGIDPMDQNAAREAKAAVDRVQGQAGAAQGAGNRVGDSAFQGAKTGIAPMPADMGNTTNQAQQEVGSYQGQFANVGRMIIEALARAILGGASSVISAAASVARQAIAAAKNALGIASPSKVFRYEVGPWIPAGLALGITDNAKVAAKAVTTMVAGMLAQRSAQLQSYALGQTMGEQIGAGLQTAVGDAFAKLPDVVKLGTVSEKLWDQLLAAGWKGRAGDGMEALYRPGVPQVIKHLDRVVSAGRGALMNKVWHDADGPTNATPQTDIVKALQNGITWRIELDPEGVAQLSAQGARSLERR